MIDRKPRLIAAVLQRAIISILLALPCHLAESAPSVAKAYLESQRANGEEEQAVAPKSADTPADLVPAAEVGASAQAEADQAATPPPEIVIEGKATLFMTERFRLESRNTADTYTIYVMLPTRYDKMDNRDHRYPVLYYLDGFLTFGAVDFIRGMQDGGLIEPFLIVATSYGAYWGTAENKRERDYTPVPVWWKEDSGKAEAFYAFLTTELMPAIEAHYRVDPQRRFFNGASLGGTFGAWVLLTRPETFEAYNLASPALGLGQEWALKAEAAWWAQRRDIPARVALSMGTEDIPALKENFQPFVDRLESRGYKDLQLKVLWGEGETHETSDTVLKPQAYRFLFPPKPKEPKAEPEAKAR